ncbi:NAD-dependent epimerase/dehydratase family protein [Achromobacter sp. UMC71]|uniref:NAD-dependent epimerase/dehydratase family protein n=1 Tax=Achromobacter sp. UMC71 TaxID=1862320 RepID=UPI00160293B6|nr:NAD-dependent dehydratase [Achromobacter sp. UMC71]
MTSPLPPARIVVTGATGQLGRKALAILARQPWCEHLIGIDLHADDTAFSPEVRDRLTLVAADLERPDPAWTRHFTGVDAVLHLAARHSTPDASWEEALGSYNMTLNVLTAAATHGVRRLVYSSSNHAMGAYKDQPLAATIGPGKLTAATEPAPGTRWFDGERDVHSLAYGTSKVMGERLCRAYSAVTQGRLSTVLARIGWILPGENDPRDMTYSGVAHQRAPAPAALDEPARRALAWFHDMWLSNEDFERLLIAALTADSADWPDGSVTVNGVSANQGSAWDVAGGQASIGYAPRDDVRRRLG